MKSRLTSVPERFVEGKAPINSNLELHYIDMGDEDSPPILMIMGLACQLTVWPVSLISELLDRGYRVILFDNRDIGLSTEIQSHLKESPPAAFLKFKLGLALDAPYTLYDMANDAAALLDYLDIRQAHVVGVSMGGMITQILCATRSDRVLSATVIMTSDNHPRNPAPDLKVLWQLNGGGVKGTDFDAARQRAINFWRTVESPSYPTPEEEVLNRFEENFQRSYRPISVLRQMRGIMATGQINTLHNAIGCPMQIIHGDSDPLVKPVCGEKLNESIKNSKLHLIEGMGHDLPKQLMPKFATLIDEHISWL